MLNMPAEYDRDAMSTKFKNISRKFPAALLGICCNQRAFVDEAGVI
jgi:hypothetical protein